MAKAFRYVAAVAQIAVGIYTGNGYLIASGIATVAQTALEKPPFVGGTQTNFKSDPYASIPIVVGRTGGVGGNLIYQKTHGSKNKYLTLVAVLSGCGPVESIDAISADKVELAFTGHAATGDYDGRIWIDSQLGECPEADELDTGEGSPPDWGSDHLLSGMAAVMYTLKYDATGKTTFNQIPRFGVLMHGVKAYDPRADDTYPGGSGTQRADDQTTWEWSENPFVIGLTYAIGWKANGIRVGGVGMNIETIEVTGFVEGANVCDANGWKVGGSFTTGDDKWGVLKSILQAGGGEPVREGATLSCIVNTPRVPIATITNDDLIGDATVPVCKSRRDRFNGVIPTYRSEDHDWETVPAGVVRNATYLAEDGGERTREIQYSLVQCAAGDTPDQAAQLAGYDVANAREADGIILPLKLRWIGYRAGDCLDCDADELGLEGQQLIVQKRSLDPSTGAVTLTLRTEDPDKHATILALSGVAAPTTAPASPPGADAPADENWTLTAEIVTGSGGSQAALVIEGHADDATWRGFIIFEMREYDPAAGDDDNWQSVSTDRNGITRKVITEGVVPGTQYQVSLQYLATFTSTQITDRLILGPVTTPGGSGPEGRWATFSGGRWMTIAGDQWVLEA